MSTVFEGAALTIATVVFDGLWQGVLIVGVVWLVLRSVPKVGAATRYAIWLCALLALALVPALTVVFSEQRSEPVTGAVASAIGERSATSLRPHARSRIAAAGEAREPAAPALKSESLAPLPHTSRLPISQSLALAVALVWLLVLCARGLQLLLDMRALVAIRQGARFWPTAHAFPIFLSDRVQVALAVGFGRPAIVLPASLIEQLPAGEIETIVIHEIAHLRRYDVWTNALARVAEAFVALDPATWFVMRRLSMQREIACDDWVVARTGTGSAFARTLAALASGVRSREPLAAPSALGSRHAIVERIERLLESRPRRLRLSLSALGGTLMLLALLALVMQAVSPVLAYESQPVRVAQASALPLATKCIVPDRGIRLMFLHGPSRNAKGTAPMNFELRDLEDVHARPGVKINAVFELTVDAAGRPSNVVIDSFPQYPGMADHIARLLKTSTYAPAIRNCVAVATRIRTATHIDAPEPNSVSVIVPVYAAGWRVQNVSSCKVPIVTHARYRSGFDAPLAYTEMLPAFPDSMKDSSIEASYTTSVRVHVDAAGAATSAALARSSGQRAFDDAAFAAARRATYPLTPTACKPLPTDYIWNTTFGWQTLP